MVRLPKATLTAGIIFDRVREERLNSMRGMKLPTFPSQVISIDLLLYCHENDTTPSIISIHTNV